MRGTITSAIVSTIVRTLYGATAAPLLSGLSDSNREHGIGDNEVASERTSSAHADTSRTSPIPHLRASCQSLTRRPYPEHERRDDADLSGMLATSLPYKHPAPWRMARHNRGVLPITIADSADKDTVDKLAAQRTHLDRTANPMYNWSFHTRIYV